MATKSKGVYIAKSAFCVDSKNEPPGRGLFAKKHFNPGDEIVSIKRALVASLDTERLADTCANCFMWVEGASSGTRLYVPDGISVQKCAGCQRFRYCSKTCQKEAWVRGHKHECKLLRSMIGRDMPKAVLACMDLLVRRKHGLISDQDWELFCQLESHVNDFKKSGSWGNMELMAMGASQFSLTQDVFDRDFVAAMYARVLTNSLTLITPSLDPLGIVLDPTISTMNHSCSPNAYITMDGASLSIRTLADVQKDEELTISYIDPTNPFAHRQEELKSRWFFTCRCAKCILGATSKEDEWKVKCNAIPRTTQHLADALQAKHSYPVPPNLDIHAQRLEIISAHAFALYSISLSTSDSSQALSFIRSAKVFPSHRQPLPSIVDDFIVQQLATSSYTIALKHCAKRYTTLDPVLYPQAWHPVRVLHVWQMGMVAAWLAASLDPLSAAEAVGIPGANLGIVAIMLVREVLEVVGRSHGLESVFARSVVEKAREMSDEMKRAGLGNEALEQEIHGQREVVRSMADALDW